MCHCLTRKMCSVFFIRNPKIWKVLQKEQNATLGTGPSHEHALFYSPLLCLTTDICCPIFSLFMCILSVKFKSYNTWSTYHIGCSKREEWGDASSLFKTKNWLRMGYAQVTVWDPGVRFQLGVSNEGRSTMLRAILYHARSSKQLKWMESWSKFIVSSALGI